MSGHSDRIAGEKRAGKEGPPGVVGPNAVIQLAGALNDGPGPEVAQKVFSAAGCPELLVTPPTAMIDERIPARLFETLWETLPDEAARQVAAEAGQRTGRYILENRIPRLVQTMLRVLPPSLSLRLLTMAVARNAWTFVGSGVCHAQASNPATIEIVGNPMPTPDCVWHQAVFAALFCHLVADHVQVRHSQCSRFGSSSCRFELTLAPSAVGAACTRPSRSTSSV